MEYLVSSPDGISPNGIYIEIGLQGAIKKGPLPLGWVMSETAQDVMQAELSKVLQDLPENHKRALGLLSSTAIGDYSK